MAKKKLFKSKTNFTLKRLHQSGSYGNIYERDYTTIANSGASPEGQIPIYNSPSFKLSVRAGFNGQKKYNTGKWLTNSESCPGNNTSWTLGCMPEANRLDSTIVLKPNTHRLTDFSCYGSASELIKASITDIIKRFPAELYVTSKTLESTGIFDTESIDLTSQIVNDGGLYIIDNPMAVDIMQAVIPENSTFSPVRYFCASEFKYDLYDKSGKLLVSGKELDNWNQQQVGNNYRVMWVVEGNEDKPCISNGDLVAIVRIGDLNSDGLPHESGSGTFINIKCYYYEGNILYVTDATPGTYIRPNKKTINEFFASLDDFEKVLLNQYTEYTAKFETYEESDTDGWYKIEHEYKWPTALGGWNLAVTGKRYGEYIDSLSKLALAYDELFTDAIWRTMTHEAIGNMDLTLTRNGEDIDIPNSSKIRQVLNVIGRQFDEIKKYADTIKQCNTITYNQDANTPDYFLPDNLNMTGWECKSILSDVSNEIITDPMYGARTIGYTASDANNEFMRRLKLNSKNIFAQKGTKRGLEDLLAVFGYHSTDWINAYLEFNGPQSLSSDIYKKSFLAIEYVYVANGYSSNKTGSETTELVRTLNQLKDTFHNDGINDDTKPMDLYQGIPVAEATNDEGKTIIVPWFNNDEKYDSGIYFQSKGGWARNDGDGTTIGRYEQTVSKIHYIISLEDLTAIPYADIDTYGLYFVAQEDKYYKVYDLNLHQDIDSGWILASDDEIDQALMIIDDNKGNNPHTGHYDGGYHFLDAFGTLFKDCTFSNAREEQLAEVGRLGFNITQQTDSTKCLFFGENYTDIEFPLRGTNRVEPYNLFSGLSGKYSEEASFSVINSKELHLVFDKTHREFLEKDVLPYVKQMIPSTTIFSYSFETLATDFEQKYVAKTNKIICDGNLCPIYGII